MRWWHGHAANFGHFTIGLTFNSHVIQVCPISKQFISLNKRLVDQKIDISSSSNRILTILKHEAIRSACLCAWCCDYGSGKPAANMLSLSSFPTLLQHILLAAGTNRGWNWGNETRTREAMPDKGGSQRRWHASISQSRVACQSCRQMCGCMRFRDCWSGKPWTFIRLHLSLYDFLLA